MRSYCTDCLTRTGKYYTLRILYNRRRVNGKQKWLGSGLFNCERCCAVAIEDNYYTNLRKDGNHIIKKLSTVSE